MSMFVRDHRGVACDVLPQLRLESDGKHLRLVNKSARAVCIAVGARLHTLDPGAKLWLVNDDGSAAAWKE